MVDKLTADHRSANMRRINCKGIKPELLVRQLTHKLGYRFRLHRADLLGRPDLVLDLAAARSYSYTAGAGTGMMIPIALIGGGNKNRIWNTGY